MQNLMNFHMILFKILRKNQNVTDGRTERRMERRNDVKTEGRKDGQPENSIPPKTPFCGGYNNVSSFYYW